MSNQADADRIVGSLARQGYNVYFGVNPRKSMGGTKDDILCVVAGHVDLDSRILPEFASRATATVWSGNGYHLYYTYTDPQYDLVKAESVNAGLALLLDADACWDVTRVLRVPGTDNLPDYRKVAKGRKRAATYVCSNRHAEVFHFHELEDLVPFVAQPEKVSISLPGTEAWTPLSTEEAERYIPFNVQDHPADRSAADWCVVCVMLRNGASELDAARFLWNTPYGKARERGPRYVQKTIENARAEQRFLERINF